MLNDTSRSNLSAYPDFIKQLIEDVSKSLDLDIDEAKAADIAANRIVIMPTRMTLADAHFNAGFLRRACQNHGVHMQWDGELKSDDIEVVCSFKFTTMEDYNKAKEAAALAPAKPAPAAAAPVEAQKPAATATESKPSAAPGKNT